MAETVDAANRRAPAAPTAAPSPKRVCSARPSACIRALLDGDESEVRKIARRLVDEGTTIVDLVEQVISPPLRSIGQAWHDGNLTIWVEHRASAIVERALGDLLPNPRGRRRGTVMVAAVSGDLHSLPTTMATAALREANWHVHHLGADMPGDELVGFCAAHDEIDVVVISLTNPDVTHLADDTRQADSRNQHFDDRRRCRPISPTVGRAGKLTEGRRDASCVMARSARKNVNQISKTCTACGRKIEWRKKWANNWDNVRYCSGACRRHGLRTIDNDLALAIKSLLDGQPRGTTICPSEAARLVARDDGSDLDGWRYLMEPTRSAARRTGRRRTS